MVYQFLNSNCPVCGDPVSSYSYVLINGKKAHIRCGKKEFVDVGCLQGRYRDNRE